MILDFHTHVFPKFFRDQRERFFHHERDFKQLYDSPKSALAGVSDLCDMMDREGVHRSVIFGFPWHRTDHFKRHNDYIIESVQQHPDRLIGFCCFDPISRDGAREAERCIRAGLSGIGELAVYDQDLSGEAIAAFTDIMEMGRQADVPMLIHTNEPVGHEYPGKAPMTLRQTYRFLKTFPKNKIVLAHWGGGIFFYTLMKKEVREVFKNVWFDTAASPFLYSEKIYRLAGETIGFEKILFGSDYPLIKPSRYFKEMETADLSRSVQDQIKGLNGATLLKLAWEKKP